LANKLGEKGVLQRAQYLVSKADCAMGWGFKDMTKKLQRKVLATTMAHNLVTLEIFHTND